MTASRGRPHRRAVRIGNSRRRDHDLVVETAAGVVVDTIAGTVAPGATSSTITLTPSAATVTDAAAIGELHYSVILDRLVTAARRTIAAGDWIVEDKAG